MLNYLNALHASLSVYYVSSGRQYDAQDDDAYDDDEIPSSNEFNYGVIFNSFFFSSEFRKRKIFGQMNMTAGKRILFHFAKCD